MEGMEKDMETVISLEVISGLCCSLLLLLCLLFLLLLLRKLEVAD